MNQKEFSDIRRRLGKTQKQMAELLGISLRGIHSFEQGWRNIPVHIERQALLLMAAKASLGEQRRPCWEVVSCTAERKENCLAYELDYGHLCWFINGKVCRGKAQKNWENKMQICRQCKFFRSAFHNNTLR